MRKRGKTDEKARNANEEKKARGARNIGRHRLTGLIRRLQWGPSVKQNGHLTVSTPASLARMRGGN